MAPDLFALHDLVRVAAMVLLACLFVFTIAQYRAVRSGRDGVSRLSARTLRNNLILGLTLMSALPAAALGLWLSGRSADLRHDRMAAYVEDLAHVTAREIDQFLALHRAGVESAALSIRAGGDFGRDALADWLDVFHRTYPDFLTMLATDRRGNIVAATLQVDGLPMPVPDLVAHNVADRPYFRVPMRTGEPFISEVFQGRGLGKDVIVAISAVLRDSDGRHRGVVEGSLNLGAFARFEANRALDHDAQIVVLDSDRRVIHASAGTGFERLQSARAAPFVVAHERDVHRGPYEFDAGNGGGRYLGAATAAAGGWTVHVRAPLGPVAQQMLGDYRAAAALLLIAVLLSLALARTLLARVTAPIATLRDLVQAIRVEGDQALPEEPAGTPEEFRPIFAQLRRRAKQLRKAHVRLTRSIAAGENLQKELTRAVALKEAEIQERTAELEDTNARLQKLSHHDALTGIANRRSFDAFVDRAWRVSARQGDWLSVLLVDVDCFKTYNDRQGHQAGDEVLVQVARALEGCATRPMDMVARYGGEEFVAVLAATTLNNALLVGERMREAVERLAIPHPDAPAGKVTVSVGIASALPTSHNSPKSTLRQADEALYRAKADGRNRVTVCQDERFVALSEYRQRHDRREKKQ